MKIIQVCLQQYVCMSTIYSMTSNNGEKEGRWIGFVLCVSIVYVSVLYVSVLYSYTLLASIWPSTLPVFPIGFNSTRVVFN